MLSQRKTFTFFYAVFISIISVLTFFSCNVRAAETILNFKSDIIVSQDSSMTVTETIKVRAEGEKIKRGIYRDFPTRYKDAYGNNYTVDFTVLDVLRDGNTEPYHIKDVDNGKRIYIGSEDVFIPAGEYTYTIKYKTDRQLGFFKDHDELYWNVTGNGWEFPIEHAAATVKLPGDASSNILSVNAYTGPQGAKGKDFTSEVDASGVSKFSTTRPLDAHEGLTIVVSWPKGFVIEPDKSEKLAYFLSDNRGVIIGLLSLVLMFVYYLVVWVIAGRDPRKGVIVVSYTPPENMTPAVMRYITKMGYDDRTFAAAVIDLAVKSHVKISEESGEYTIKKTDETAPLSTEEERILKKLFGSGKEITFKKENNGKIREAIDALKSYLSMSFEKLYFIKNTGCFAAGILLTITMLGLSGHSMAAAKGKLEIFLFISLWLSIWSMGVTALIVIIISGWKKVISIKPRNPSNTAGAVFITLFGLPFFAGEIVGLVILSTSTSIFMVLLLIILIGINYLFYHLLKAPTRAGRKLLDAIDGFKRFLVATEKDRMNMMNPPERTPQLFEKYLPYALALDVEQAWSEQFSNVLAASASGKQERGYSPSWLSTTTFSSMAVGDFASSFSGSFAEAISSSSSPPGSSSGSSGGGSSGGGGGGGGGGGW